MITYQITPFLNNVSFFESFCSFRVGCFTAIKNASRFFLLRLFIGADIRTFHWKTWSRCWKRCLARSESLFGFSCWFQRVITFRLVSPMQFSLQEQTPSYILHEGYGFFSFKGKSYVTFFVFQTILKSYFSLMKTFNHDYFANVVLILTCFCFLFSYFISSNVKLFFFQIFCQIYLHYNIAENRNKRIIEV